MGLLKMDLVLDARRAPERLDAIIEGYGRLFRDWRVPMERAAQVIYEHVQEWYESEGEGSWEPLTPATISRKERLGYAYPDWPLYATGALYESATGAGGPYSVLHIDRDGLEIGVDWEPATYLQEGTDTMPARPIFVLTDQLIVRITRELERHLRTRV